MSESATIKAFTTTKTNQVRQIKKAEYLPVVSHNNLRVENSPISKTHSLQGEYLRAFVGIAIGKNSVRKFWVQNSTCRDFMTAQPNETKNPRLKYEV